MGAYTNPKLYGLDFSVITENTSEAAAKIAYATAKQQEERAKREKEFKDSYKDFISKAYLDANDYLAEEYRNTLNDSLQDIENFANMSEADKQNRIRNVEATNAGMKEIAAKMPELATMDIDIKEYSNPSVLLLAAMARGDKDAFKSVKDPNNPMVINWRYTEKDPDTGESRTYDISMKDLRMSMASLQDISPRIDAIDNELSALAEQYQKNINSFATRGARFDWESKFSEYFKGMDEEELDLYYRNAFPDIRGVDYTPNINPATNKPWGDSEEEQAEREKLYNEKRQDLEARLKQKITGLLADTPLAMTEQQRYAMRQRFEEQTRLDGSTKQQKFDFLPRNVRQDLKDVLNIAFPRKQTPEQMSNFVSNLGYRDVTVEFEEAGKTIKERVARTTATDNLIAKKIEGADKDKQIQVTDAFILGGLLHITGRSYIPGEGFIEETLLKIPPSGIDNLLVTGSATTSTDPLGVRN